MELEEEEGVVVLFHNNIRVKEKKTVAVLSVKLVHNILLTSRHLSPFQSLIVIIGIYIQEQEQQWL